MKNKNPKTKLQPRSRRTTITRMAMVPKDSQRAGADGLRTIKHQASDVVAAHAAAAAAAAAAGGVFLPGSFLNAKHPDPE